MSQVSLGAIICHGPQWVELGLLRRTIEKVASIGRFFVSHRSQVAFRPDGGLSILSSRADVMAGGRRPASKHKRVQGEFVIHSELFLRYFPFFGKT